jgi:uncharacterized protein (TIGR00369 family)
MRTLPHTRSCFVCGESNPAGLNLRFETDEQIVRTRFTPRPEHVGFKQIIHGGIIATLLDEVMAWACAIGTKRFGFCVEMSVRFVKSTRPAEELVVTGELAENRRNKIFNARAEVRNLAGEIIATATGTYLPIKESEAAEMATDFVGNPQWVPPS